MKRTVYAVGGVAALALAVVVSAQLWAQGTTPTRPATTTAPAPQTKVALVNLSYVLKGYQKAKSFSEEMKTAVKPFQDNDTKYQKEAEGLSKEAQDAKTTADRRDAIAKRMKELQRLVEDNKNDAQKVVGKKQEEQIKILFMDVHAVVTRVAQARGYEMVLQFNDATESLEYWSAQNIVRKMQAGALMPIYYVGGLDISKDVLETLNSSAKR